MRMTLGLVLASLTAACATDATTDSANSSEVTVKPDDDLEPSYVNGVQCQIVFQGALSEDTEWYAIWAVGRNGILDDVPYNTDARPNLYAIFGTGRPSFETHHVDGYDQFDHYHVAQNDHQDQTVSNVVWDVLTLWPGPNFEAATYTSAKTVEELMAQSEAGILSPVLTLPDIGFPELVLRAPIICP